MIPRRHNVGIHAFLVTALLASLLSSTGCQAPKAKTKSAGPEPATVIPGTVSKATMIVHRSFHKLSIRQENINTSLAHSVIVGRAAGGDRVTVFLHPRGEKHVRVTIQTKPDNGRLMRDLTKAIKAGG